MSDIEVPKMIGHIDGTPRMSDNCWKAIITQVEASEPTCRFLEWGSGNSTLCLIRNAIERAFSLDYDSIEHDPIFFCALLREIMRYIKSTSVNGTFTFEQIQRFARPSFKRAKQEIAQLENHFIFWQYLSGNRYFKLYAGSHSNFPIRLLGMMKRMMIYLVGRMHFYAQCVVTCRDEHLWHQQQHVKLMDAKIPEVNQLTKGGRVTIKLPLVNLHLMCLPSQPNPLTQRRTFDGLFTEFYQYVMTPMQHDSYNVILVDGRARASCVNRVFHEQLLSDQGAIFVHDAHMDELYRAFQLFSNEYTFLDGTNRTLKGDQLRLEYGLPIVSAGMNLKNMIQKNSREMWLYHKY